MYTYIYAHILCVDRPIKTQSCYLGKPNTTRTDLTHTQYRLHDSAVSVFSSRETQSYTHCQCVFISGNPILHPQISRTHNIAYLTVL